jgi:hypothetical protein
MKTEINLRTFYIKNHYKNEEDIGWGVKKTWNCQVWESGQLFKEQKNGIVNKSYEASAYAVMFLVMDLTRTNKYRGEVVIYVPNEGLVIEANGNGCNPNSDDWLYINRRGLKFAQQEELRALVEFSKTKWVARLYYLGLAYLISKRNGIDLNLKFLAEEQIELVNKIQGEFFKTKGENNPILGEK